MPHNPKASLLINNWDFDFISQKKYEIVTSTHIIHHKHSEMAKH